MHFSQRSKHFERFWWLHVCILRNTQDCQTLLPIYPFTRRSFKIANLPTNVFAIKKYHTKIGVVKVTCYVIRFIEQEQWLGGFKDK